MSGGVGGGMAKVTVRPAVSSAMGSAAMATAVSAGVMSTPVDPAAVVPADFVAPVMGPGVPGVTSVSRVET